MSLTLNRICLKILRIGHAHGVTRWVSFGLTVLLFPTLIVGCRTVQTSEKLAFVSVQGENAWLYISHVGNLEPRRVSNIVNWSRPAWSPDGRSLAFLADYQDLPTLYMKGESDETPRRLTTGMRVGTYAWSPDGKEIAISAIRGEDEDIYIVSLDTLQLVNLTSGNAAADTTPVWSHDGTRLAFLSSAGVKNSHLCQEGCRYQMYIVDKSGSNSRQITARSPLAEDHMGECAPAWSPDDRYLAFTHGCFLSDPAMNIYVFDLQTEEITQLTTNNIDHGAIWLSNDEILFRSFRDGACVEQLYAMNRDGANQRPFLPWNVVDINSLACANGFRWFAWQDADTREILVGDITTAEVIRTGVQGCNPRWSPSGSKIAFTTECLGTNRSDVWLMNRDGTLALNLTENLAGKNYQPVWAP